MIEDVFIIDSVAHAYNFTPENCLNDPLSEALGEACYAGLHLGFQPKDETQWALPKERFDNALAPEFIAHAFFAESPTDLAIYHQIPLYGLYRDGLSPLWVGEEMRERYPGRVLIFGGISPWQPDALEEIDRLIDEVGVSGIKFYPEDIIDGTVKPWRLDDPEVAFPLFERIQQKGIKSVALHKSQPLGPVPIEPFKPGDVEGAAIAFPDLTFEIVHGGWAFLEETATQLARFPNVVINLECTSAMLVRQPRRFAEILGTFMINGGGSDRLIWATGTMLYHPRPYVDAFWDFEMPEDLIEGYGFPEVTRQDKVNILGANQARLLGLDLEAVKASISDDEFSQRDGFAEPWTGEYAPRQSRAA